MNENEVQDDNEMIPDEQAQNEINLPYDYNELFDNPIANDTIIELIKADRQLNDEIHKTELAQVNADWQDKIRSTIAESGQIINQLQNQVATHQSQIAQLTFEKNDAEQKRDAAATQLAEANAEIARLNDHVSDLQQQIANAPAPKAAIEIGSSNRLAELAQKAKESNAEKAARGIARWNAAHPDIVTPLDIPALPQVVEPNEEVTQDDFRDSGGTLPGIPVVQSGESVVEGDNGDIPEAAEESPITLESLHARLSAVEAQLGVKAAA